MGYQLSFRSNRIGLSIDFLSLAENVPCEGEEIDFSLPNYRYRLISVVSEVSHNPFTRIAKVICWVKSYDLVSVARIIGNNGRIICADEEVLKKFNQCIKAENITAKLIEFDWFE